MSLFSLQAPWRSCTNVRIVHARWLLASNCRTTGEKNMGLKMWSAPIAPNMQFKTPPSRGIWDSSIHSMMSSSVRPPQCTILLWRAARIGVSPGMFRAPVQPLRAGLTPCYASGRQHAAAQATPPYSAKQRRTGLACLMTASHCSLVGMTCQMTSTRCLC